jgi:hypothetical protein
LPPTEETDAVTKLTVGIPRETRPGETRVALTPDVIRQLSRKPFEVIVERGAGELAGFTDDAYESAGARLVDTASMVYSSARVILKIQRPTDGEIPSLSEGQTLIALLQPLTNQDNVVKLAEQKVTALSMDAIPRITRAQPMDALSSQSTVAGYKAVLLAATHLGRMKIRCRVLRLNIKHIGPQNREGFQQNQNVRHVIGGCQALAHRRFAEPLQHGAWWGPSNGRRRERCHDRKGYAFRYRNRAPARPDGA